jgi:hypothetical protein
MIYQIELSTKAKHEMIKAGGFDKQECVDQSRGNLAQGSI